jgi:quinol monooxygenase YgiN
VGWGNKVLCGKFEIIAGFRFTRSNARGKRGVQLGKSLSAVMHQTGPIGGHMYKRLLLYCWVAVLFGLNPSNASGENMSEPLVRIAEIEVDAPQLEAYKTALKEEIAASINVEPGVLTLLAVSVKGHPTQIRIFETYADQAAYEAHLQTPHFKKYKSETQGMVKSLKLIETDPIRLGAKSIKR